MSLALLIAHLGAFHSLMLVTTRYTYPLPPQACHIHLSKLLRQALLGTKTPARPKTFGPSKAPIRAQKQKPPEKNRSRLLADKNPVTIGSTYASGENCQGHPTRSQAREVERADKVKNSITICRFRSSSSKIQAKQLRGRKKSSRTVADPASASASASASLLFDGGARKRDQARAEENQGERKKSIFWCWLL